MPGAQLTETPVYVRLTTQPIYIGTLQLTADAVFKGLPLGFVIIGVQTDNLRRGRVGGYFVANAGAWRSAGRLQSKGNRYWIANEYRKQGSCQLPRISQTEAPRPRHYG
jgi:hypothetical protein